ERQSITHKFSIGGHEGYITAGMYEDGTPGEIFIVMAKEGSAVSGLMDAFATAISMALQYGVPIKILCNKFTHSRFEPSGFTNNPNIPYAKSIMDYIFRWLALKFLSKEEQLRFMSEEFVEDNNRIDIETGDESSSLMESVPTSHEDDKESSQLDFSGQLLKVQQHEKVVFQTQADAPNCPECGSIMVRNGNCYKCLECGTTSGCS
ncbi:MAG: vitamin B12-dependent ribonucleotide reductase, partial [Calditrichota bacterium]